MNRRISRLIRANRNIVKYLSCSLTAPKKARSFLAYVYLFDPEPESKYIPNKSLFDFFPGATDEPVILKKAYVEHGNMTHEELYSICLLVRCVRPKKLFEIGTFNGNTTFHLALNTLPESRIWTLNLPGEEIAPVFSHSAQDRMVVRNKTRSGERFHNTPEAARITELFGDSALFDYSSFKNTIDFVLIDAGHEYDYVRNDTNKALEMLTENGWLVWHDYPTAPGVADFLNEFAQREKVFKIPNTRLAYSQIRNKTKA